MKLGGMNMGTVADHGTKREHDRMVSMQTWSSVEDEGTVYMVAHSSHAHYFYKKGPLS